MKRTKGTIERFSEEWIRAIPYWLARGIWEGIREGIEGGAHAKTRETERRRQQIERGILGPSSRGSIQTTSEAIERHEARLRAADDERIQAIGTPAFVPKFQWNFVEPTDNGRGGSSSSDGVRGHSEPRGVGK